MGTLSSLNIKSTSQIMVAIAKKHEVAVKTGSEKPPSLYAWFSSCGVIDSVPGQTIAIRGRITSVLAGSRSVVIHLFDCHGVPFSAIFFRGVRHFSNVLKVGMDVGLVGKSSIEKAQVMITQPSIISCDEVPHVINDMCSDMPEQTKKDLISRCSTPKKQMKPWDEACIDHAKIWEASKILSGLSAEHDGAKAAGLPMPNLPEIANNYLGDLPYTPTPDQKKAVFDAVKSMGAGVKIHHLMNGDVAVGKSGVSAVICHAVADAGYTSVIMVPSTILVGQWVKVLEAIKTGSHHSIGVCTEAHKETEANIIVGTTALLGQWDAIEDIGVLVVDECHKFGVDQKNSFSAIHSNTSLIEMSATPQPRSLAMVRTGLTGVSHLRTRAIERNVKTKVFDDIYEIFKLCHWTVRKGYKAIVVFPAIERSKSGMTAVKEMFASWQKTLGGHLGLVHGKMTVEEKDEALQCFRDGETSIMLSTVVVETGLDIPDIKLVAIVDAHRFGLAQLHQIRGRVGRNGDDAFCALYSEKANGKARLRVMENCFDGFELSNHDLRYRGWGCIEGLEQNGSHTIFLNPYSPDDLHYFDMAVNEIPGGHI